MRLHDDRWWLHGLGLTLFVLALAPAAPQQQPAPGDQPAARPTVSLAKDRAEQGAKTYDLAWLYYTEDRIDADRVYRWSRRAWEADTAAATDQAGRLAAAETHLGRMLKLETKIARIRQLGFGTSLDVAEVEYYRKEAELWRASVRGN